MDNNNTINILDSTSNPAPLGLMAFGMTTVLLNIVNAGIMPFSSMILAMGIFYGGLAQVIAGIMEWKKKNTFGTLAFTSYGMFWLTLVGLIVMHQFVAKPFGSLDEVSLGYYLGIWGVFTGLLFIGTLRINRALQVVFLTLTVLFFLLAAEKFTGSAAIGHFAGWEGIVCGASAMYAGIAQVWNEIYGRTVLPLGPVS